MEYYNSIEKALQAFLNRLQGFITDGYEILFQCDMPGSFFVCLRNVHGNKISLYYDKKENEAHQVVNNNDEIFGKVREFGLAGSACS